MKTAPAYCRPAAFDAFRESLPGAAVPRGLFRAAWAIAMHAMPEAELSIGETIVENLAGTVRRRVQSPAAAAVLAHLHDVLFDVYGLSGNTDDYYAPANSYLPEVVRTRRGIPITLTLLYFRVGSDVGLKVHGINAPGHFLAEVEDPETDGVTMLVDSFDGGRVLSHDEAMHRIAAATGREVPPSARVLVRATPHQWLDRMLNNLQASLAAAGQDRDVLAMQELQELLREGGLHRGMATSPPT